MKKMMRNGCPTAAAWLVLSLACGAVQASEKEDLLELRNTIVNLVEALVEQGVISAEQADNLKREAAAKAAVEAREQALAEAPAETPAAGNQKPAQTIRVPYVPEFVKDEIRDQVREELREDVAADVVQQARVERWGVPAALPDWMERIKLDGDLRVRGQGDFYSDDNIAFENGDGFFVDYEQLNADGGVLTREALINSSEDNQRGRLRLRLGLEAQIFDDLVALTRLSTGNEGNAISIQRTFDNNFGSYDLVVDRAYMRYVMRDEANSPWATLFAGRMPNPFMKTDLTWDPDLQFDGVAANLRLGVPFVADGAPTVFANLGLFPLEEIQIDENDKWFWGAQTGLAFAFEDRSKLQVGAAYYNYNNITGRINPLNQTIFDFTAPSTLQKGNSLFDISNIDTDGDGFVDPNQRFGLASDYDLLNLTAMYDFARFDPIHVVITADYVNNIGWNTGDIRQRLNGRNLIVNNLSPTIVAATPDDDDTQGYLAQVLVGFTEDFARNAWYVSLTYKYLERDAVLDAFAESNFHLGGTNAKGWILEGRYGFLDRAYVQARYITADEIEGPSLGIDILQFDLNLSF